MCDQISNFEVEKKITEVDRLCQQLNVCQSMNTHMTTELVDGAMLRERALIDPAIVVDILF